MNGVVSDQLLVTLTQPTAVQVTFVSSNNVSCYGESDGSIEVSASGGSGAGYEYRIDVGPWVSNSGNFSGLLAGSHTLRARDGNGCESSDLVVPLTQPAQAVSGSVVKEIKLAGYTGSIQWQKSANGSAWEDIPGATSATLDVSTLYTATPYFRAKVTTGVACSVYSSRTRVTDTEYSGTVFVFQ